MGWLSNDLYNHKLTNRGAENILSIKFNSQSKESIVQYIALSIKFNSRSKEHSAVHCPVNQI